MGCSQGDARVVRSWLSHSRASLALLGGFAAIALMAISCWASASSTRDLYSVALNTIMQPSAALAQEQARPLRGLGRHERAPTANSGFCCWRAAEHWYRGWLLLFVQYSRRGERLESYAT
jgi:hypothetical protein